MAIVAGVAVVATVAVVLRDPPAPPRCNDAVAPRNPDDVVNLVRQLRTTDAGYELELWSREQFHVRAMPTLLRIGEVDTRFTRLDQWSNTLVFEIPDDEYERLRTGDAILVHHMLIPLALQENPNLAGNVIATNGGNIWTFGRFDKSQVDCPPLELPADEAARRSG